MTRTNPQAGLYPPKPRQDVELPVLALDELIADEGGAIVLYDDSHVGRMTIATDLRIVDEGRAQRSPTRSGVDVRNMRYLRLEDGRTLYFDAELQVDIRPAAVLRR